MDIIQKIRMACTYRGISEAELARMIGTSPQNLCKRFKTGKFTDEQLKQIAGALGAEYVSELRWPDGTVI